MLIDHSGAVLFPQHIILRYIGRLAFPIFAYQISIGYQKTSNVYKYMGRLAILAFISQLPYWLAFHNGVNIFFTLLYGLVVLYVYDRIDNILGIAFMLPSLLLTQMDYGFYGICMILLFYIFKENFLLQSVTVTFLTLFYGYVEHGSEIQTFCLVALILIYVIPKINWNIRMNKYIFYFFYPIHLLILYFISISLY